MGVADKKVDVKGEQKEGVGELIRVVVYALLIAIFLRTFLFQPFNIPSGSMKPTLLVGDYVFVSKFSYGYSKFSFPLSPDLFDGRILASEPERGDIIVFRLPRDNHVDYIKRLIGLPGDHIQMRDDILYINGQPVQRERVEDFVERDPFGNEIRTPQYRETLPNGVSYTILDATPNGEYDNTQEFVVPPGHYFFMGDNRDNSADSRADVGYVPFENLIGRARLIFFSVDEGTAAWEIWRWPWSVRWDRLISIPD